jgi:hypothetical protein
MSSAANSNSEPLETVRTAVFGVAAQVILFVDSYLAWPGENERKLR